MFCIQVAEIEKTEPLPQPSQDTCEIEQQSQQQQQQYDVDAVEPMVLLAPDGGKYTCVILHYNIWKQLK